MHCPNLQELPMPPAGATGWPWTKGSQSLPAQMPDDRESPRVTVVTPSFNQGRFLEATLRSILLQGYPNLEYLVLDGGSTDSSVEIKKYERWLTYWVSERDGGQSAAINRGLRMGRELGDSLEDLMSPIAERGDAFHFLQTDGSLGPPVDVRLNARSGHSFDIVARPTST
jgi:glycosyltransferase involved in cell wall biosynthesis